MRIFTKSLLLICCCLLSTEVFAQPTANFTATPIVGCAPLLVQFTSTSTGNPTSYQWNLGNGTTPVIANPSTSYTTPGVYTVTLTVTNASGSNTKTVTNYITVYGAPIVSFSASDTASCPPLFTNFTNSSTPVTPGPATYNWSFGDGFVSNLQNPGHNYPNPGYYNVTLVVTNSGGCVSSLTKPNYIHVYTPPVGDFSASNTNNCNTPATVSFTPTISGSGGPYTYSWDYGDGGNGTGNNPSHTYTTAGSYTVSMIVTDVHGCKDTVVKSNYVAVGTLTAAFTTTPTAGCVNTPIDFNNNSIGASSNLWNFGDGTTTLGTNPIHVYTAAGVYNVKLIVYDGTCSDSITIPVTINPRPTASFDYLPNPPCPAPISIQFNNSSTGGTNYSWIFGDGGTSNAFSPSHTYNAAGIYSPELIVTGANGCMDTIIKQDSLIFYPLELAAGAVPVQGCVPLEVHFNSQTYTSIPVVGALYPFSTSVYNWDFGDGFTSTLDTPIHTYTAAGTYSVTLTITTINGCTAMDTFQIHVGIHPTPGFTVAPDTICNHGTVYFTNTSTNATSYIWDFGDGGSSGGTNPSHIYTSSGIYTIILHAYNNGCEDTFKLDSIVTVHPPTSKWYAKYNCDTPLLVKFIDTATIGATSRHWDFGDGNTSTSSSPIHTYSTLGTYTVSQITYNNIYGCTDTMTNVIQLIDPHLSFVTSDTAICRGDSITFYPTYTGIPASTYQWYINWGFIDTSYGQWGYRYNQNGIYNMQVRVMDLHACWDTSIRNAYVHVSKPTAAFEALPPVGCVPLSVLFTDTSHNIPGAYSVTRAWDFGNGTTTVNTASTNHLYNAAGLYNVTLIVTDNVGCSDTLTKTNYIDARKPIASFNANDTTLCIGQTAQFTNTSVGTSLTAVWSFGDGGTSTAFTTTHSYTATGNYTVKLVVTDPSGCKDSITKTNYINVSKPNAAFSMSDTFAICPPLNVLFTNISTGAITYAWTFGNSSNSSLQNPSAIYTNPSIYTIQLIATSNQGCTDTATATANVLGYAGGLSYTPLTGCAPLGVQFTANLTNVPSIVWDFSDGVTLPANGSSTTNHTYVTPGAYVPKLILSDGLGCLNSSQGLDTIKVDGILSGFITSPACVNTQIQFQDTSFSFFSPINNWLWNFSNGQQISTINNPTFQYNTPGNYSISLIVTNAHGCSDTLVKNITVYPLPTVIAGPDTSVCAGDAAQLLASGTASYLWTPVTGVNCSNCQNTTATPTSSTDYVVTGTDVHGCVNKDSVHVNVQLITTSAVGNGGNICDDSTFQLLAYGAQTYVWHPAMTLDNPNIANPVAAPHTTTTYTVLAYEGSCPPDSQTVNVTVFPKPTVNAGGDQTIIAGTSTMLNAIGSNISTFTWSPTGTLSCTTCSNPNANPNSTTSYTVIATSVHGCKSADTVTVFVLCDQSQVFVPNTFSPNGDGQNDVFFPRGSGLKYIKSFRVYNRWGEKVFEKTGIQLNDEANGWDGKYKGQDLSPDVYVYAIDGECEGGETVSWKGDVTLIR